MSAVLQLTLVLTQILFILSVYHQFQNLFMPREQLMG